MKKKTGNNTLYVSRGRKKLEEKKDLKIVEEKKEDGETKKGKRTK